MQFRTTEDIRLPIRLAWTEVTNFNGFEKLIRERGGEVTRSDTPHPPGLGTRWDGRFSYSGKVRDVSGEVIRFDAPHHLGLSLLSAGLQGTLTIELADLGQRRTQLSVVLTLEARGLKARIFLQPLKLAHATMQARFAKGIAKLARAMERRRKA